MKETEFVLTWIWYSILVIFWEERRIYDFPLLFLRWAACSEFWGPNLFQKSLEAFDGLISLNKAAIAVLFGM